MNPLTGFIIVFIATTFQIKLYTIKRLQEPLELSFSDTQNSNKIYNSKRDYWENTEITIGRITMLGLLALVLNYGFFGFIIPVFI